MFRQEIWEVPEEYVADSMGNSAVEFLVGRKPIGTYGNVSVRGGSIAFGHSHPIGSVGERLYDQILILISPFAHHRVGVDYRGNILDDVLLLPSLVMKGYSTSRQRLQSSSDVNFGPTRGAYMKIWEGKLDKLLHQT